MLVSLGAAALHVRANRDGKQVAAPKTTSVLIVLALLASLGTGLASCSSEGGTKEETTSSGTLAQAQTGTLKLTVYALGLSLDGSDLPVTIIDTQSGATAYSQTISIGETTPIEIEPGTYTITCDATALAVDGSSYSAASAGVNVREGMTASASLWLKEEPASTAPDEVNVDTTQSTETVTAGADLGAAETSNMPEEAASVEQPTDIQATGVPATEGEATYAEEVPVEEAAVEVPSTPAEQVVEEEPVYEEVYEEPVETLVWIPTNGGQRYHSNSTCSGMENPQQVTLSEAQAMWFTPCGRCY